ncbi:nucleoside deaminase [Sorangium atrum]|uniref:Nucleoside deaminase n=1 Tax=Sorangium atrum TaxID=2995308 RepID=A0ABT5C599_9BACT|nr:nucleoside deaminase [Sorangium aterium]MDC0681590.1 nucleoside deaminase [Sorangium aterium]
MSRDEALMARALELARGAQRAGEPPFGALVAAPDGTVVAEATDEVNAQRDFTWHAEVGAVRRACAAAGPDLTGYTLYTTVEPCPMCFTAAWLARVSRVIFGCTMQEVTAATGGAQRELAVPARWMNENSGAPVDLVGGVLADRCLALFSPS